MAWKLLGKEAVDLRETTAGISEFFSRWLFLRWGLKMLMWSWLNFCRHFDPEKSSLIRWKYAGQKFIQKISKAECLKITEKVSFNIAKLMVKHLNSVARQVNFDRTKIGGKYRKYKNSKIEMRHFGWFSNTMSFRFVLDLSSYRISILINYVINS